jgi:hypothetical protein
MAIDYTIDYQCVPKQSLTPDGILDRLKGKARAERVIRLFRQNNDYRPPAQMGFEFSRNTPNGEEETKVINVQDMLDRATELDPLAHYCEGCPARVIEESFGCFGRIDYPISRAAEVWLLRQLPITSEFLSWTLLRQQLADMGVDGAIVNPMRLPDQPFFEEQQILAKQLGEYGVSTNQLFQLLFLAGGAIKPAYAAVLLVVFKAIRRDLEAPELMTLTQSPDDAFGCYPFLMASAPEDDLSISQYKSFFKALWLAWGLNVPLLLDV